MSDMKRSFSEDMRLGSMLSPQVCSDGYFSERGTCAIGAIAEARNIRSSVEIAYLEMAMNLLVTGTLNCPQCGDRKMTLSSAVIHLNDAHKWTREAIADWVETVERRAEADQAGTTPETASASVRRVPQKV